MRTFLKVTNKGGAIVWLNIAAITDATAQPDGTFIIHYAATGAGIKYISVTEAAEISEIQNVLDRAATD